MNRALIRSEPDPLGGGAQLVYQPDEPDWAHAWTTTPDGKFQPVADVHLVCGSTSCFTQTQPDGSVRHVCRDCVTDAATRGEE